MIVKKYQLTNPVKIEKSTAKGSGDSAVNIIKRDGVITEIEVVCKCGEKTRIMLSYKK